MPQDNDDLANDLLIGAQAIAAFMGVSERWVYQQAAQGNLATFKNGPLVCARKSELRATQSAHASQRGGR